MRVCLSILIASCLLSLQTAFSQITSCNLSLQAIPTGATCDNACNGSVTLVPTGGTAPYSYNAFEHSFPGNVIDQSVLDVRNGNFSVSGNQLSAQANSSLNNGFDNVVSSKQSFPDNGKLVVEGTFYVNYNTLAYFGLADDAVIFRQSQVRFAFYFNLGQLYISNQGSLILVGNYSANTWYDLKIEKEGATVKYYMRNAGLSTYTLIGTTTATLIRPAYKLASMYFVSTDSYGGFLSRNWRVGGNPPTTGLCPGTYVYTVYDAVGCYSTASVTIGAAASGPNSLQINGSVTAASCQVSNDGAINLNPSGGTAPYTYGFAHNFSGGTINNTLFDLRNGNFSQGTDLREGISYNNIGSWDNSIATRNTFSDGGYLVFTSSFKFDPLAEVVFGFTNTGTIDDFSDVFFGYKVTNGSVLSSYTNTSGLLQIGTINPDTWYDFKIEKIGSTINFYTRLTGTTQYVLRATRLYVTTNVEYKVAALNFANFYSSSCGYNTTGWNAESTPKTSRLSPGTYTYTITDASGCTATAVFNVVAGGSAAGVALNATLVSPAIQNGPLGQVSLTPSGGTAPYKYQFEQSFSESQINESMFVVRNGAFNQSGGNLRSNPIPNNTSQDNSIATRFSFPDGGLISFEGSFRFDNNANVYLGLTSNAPNINNIALLQIGFFVNNGQLFARAGLTNNQSLGSIISETWYDLKVVNTDGEVKFYTRPSGSVNYNLVLTTTYAGVETEFKGAVIAIGANAGFNTKSWVINCNPDTTGLMPGLYTYRVYDAAGCYATASINVTQIAAVVPPANVRRNTDNGKPFATVTDLGQPSFVNSSPNRTVSNNAPVSKEFPIGKTIVTWTIVDGSNVFTANQEVIVEDKEAPQISAVQNITVNTNPGAATATVNLGAPSATDNSGGAVTLISNAPSVFPIGTTTVTWTATDAAGNTTIATQLVTVVDAELPSITAPANITVNTNNGAAFATILNIGNATANDNSGNVTISKSTSATQFNIGTTTVTWTATDAAGNTATATQTITVIDAEKPSITAPANVTVQAGSNGVATGVNLGNATANDNSGNVTITNNAPAQFPTGSTTVIWTATDAAGNFATATQVVTVSNCGNYSVSVVSQPTSNVFTGGNANILYLGYGAQSTRLQVSVPNTGGPYTFQWSGNGLSSTTSSAPVFTPTAAGVYNFTVNVKNNNGCASTAFISICVRDARVLNSNGNWDGKKVYVCHLPPGNPSNGQLLSVSVNAVSAHVGNHGGDNLGTCNQTCSAPMASRGATPVAEAFSVKAYPNPSADFFRLQVKTADIYTRITLKIVDAFGRTVEVFNNVTADKVLNFGDKYPSGAYYAEVTQGEERKMIPLVKTK